MVGGDCWGGSDILGTFRSAPSSPRRPSLVNGLPTFRPSDPTACDFRPTRIGTPAAGARSRKTALTCVKAAFATVARAGGEPATFRFRVSGLQSSVSSSTRDQAMPTQVRVDTSLSEVAKATRGFEVRAPSGRYCEKQFRSVSEPTLRGREVMLPDELANDMHEKPLRWYPDTPLFGRDPDEVTSVHDDPDGATSRDQWLVFQRRIGLSLMFVAAPVLLPSTVKDSQGHHPYFEFWFYGMAPLMLGIVLFVWQKHLRRQTGYLIPPRFREVIDAMLVSDQLIRQHLLGHLSLKARQGYRGQFNQMLGHLDELERSRVTRNQRRWTKYAEKVFNDCAAIINLAREATGHKWDDEEDDDSSSTPQ